MRSLFNKLSAIAAGAGICLSPIVFCPVAEGEDLKALEAHASGYDLYALIDADSTETEGQGSGTYQGAVNQASLTTNAGTIEFPASVVQSSVIQFVNGSPTTGDILTVSFSFDLEAQPPVLGGHELVSIRLNFKDNEAGVYESATPLASALELLESLDFDLKDLQLILRDSEGNTISSLHPVDPIVVYDYMPPAKVPVGSKSVPALVLSLSVAATLVLNKQKKSQPQQDLSLNP